MHKAKKSHHVILIMVSCFLFSTHLQAQEIIALHPFKGPAEGEAITGLFFERIEQELPNAGGGNFRGFPINLAQLPPDVPPGGFPPWICTSPSVTGTSAFAITGEAAPDQYFEGAFRMRLYLWRMEDARLLGSDELTVMGPDDLEPLVGFLDWVLSWIESDVSPENIATVGIGYLSPYHQSWLYLGLRGGGGYSRWIYDYRDVTEMASANIALQASFYFTRFFAVHTELNLLSDFRMGQGFFMSLNLNIPVMLKLVFIGERVKAGVFGGVYFHLPLTQLGNNVFVTYYDYQADFPGFVFGLSVGWRLGPGNLFFDGRFEYDRHWFNTELKRINSRDSVRFNIGYEIGLFRKR